MCEVATFCVQFTYCPLLLVPLIKYSADRRGYCLVAARWVSHLWHSKVEPTNQNQLQNRCQQFPDMALSSTPSWPLSVSVHAVSDRLQINRKCLIEFSLQSCIHISTSKYSFQPLYVQDNDSIISLLLHFYFLLNYQQKLSLGSVRYWPS